MKLITFFLFFLFTSYSIASETTPVPEVTLSPRFQKDVATVNFSKVSLSDFIALVYGEVFQSPYVLDPSVVSDQRIISTRLEISKKSHSQLKALFDSLDLVVEKKNGVDLISMREVPYGKDKEVHLYYPKYRDATYLSDLLRVLFTGTFTSIQQPQPLPSQAFQQPQQPQQPQPQPIPVNQTVQTGFSPSRSTDVLVFTGTSTEIARLKKLLPQVDLKQGEVMLRATVYEVSTSAADGSGFRLALNLLSSKLQLAIGEAPLSGQAVSFKTPAIDAVFSALASDGRFKTVSSPSIRVRSGGVGHFSVGQDVPVLGAVTYPGNGAAPVQSVEYRSSGVIFDVRPTVHENTVDLSINQQLSSFANTSTGVNNSPTLIKREIRTDLSLTDGEIVVIGGLNESKETNGHSGLSFLPSFFHTKSSSQTQGDIILVLQMQKL